VLKSKIKVFVYTILLGLFAVHSFAFAQLVQCGRRGQEACKLQDLKGLVIGVVNYALLAAGFVALAFVLLGGIRMMLSGGNPEQIKAGKTAIFNALLGLVITMAAFIILNLLITVLTGGALNLNSLVNFWNP
jgi:hypothetical protein